MIAATSQTSASALRLRVTGLVQGVGFRPFVHRLAMRHGLSGWVLNAAGDVQIRVEGDADEIAAFVTNLRAEAPPLARIEEVTTQPCAPSGLERFTILDSRNEPDRRQPVSPDGALCRACERVLFT